MARPMVGARGRLAMAAVVLAALGSTARAADPTPAAASPPPQTTTPAAASPRPQTTTPAAAFPPPQTTTPAAASPPPEGTPVAPSASPEGTSAAHAPQPEAATPSVTLTLAETSPIIGLTGETALSIEVANGPLSPMPIPRVLCSSGHIEDLGREGPAKFTARYILPTSRYPQPAILVAEFTGGTWPLRGMTTVRLRAAATPSFRTDPGAQVTLRVADRDYGPQVAAADGMVHVPVVVPPGVELAVARSVNQHGKSTEQVIDLHVPYSQRVLIAAPEVLTAGALGEVAVYAVDPSGRTADAADLVLRAGPNRVQPLGSRVPGEARFLISTPTVLRQKTMRVEAQLKGQSTTLTAARIGLVPDRATGLMLEPEGPQLERKTSSSLRVFLGAEDAFGNPVDAAQASVLIDGKPAEVKTNAAGENLVVVHGPSSAFDSDAVLVEGVLDGAHAFKRIPVQTRAKAAPPVAPSYLATPRYTLTPRLGVLSNFGALSGVTLFVDGFVHPSAHDRGLGLGFAVGTIQSWFYAESAGGISRAELSTFPVSFQIRQNVVFGRLFAGVGAGAGFAMATARVHSYDTTVVGRTFGAITEASVETGVLLRRAHLVLALHYVGLYLSDFSSGDHLASNAGGTMLDVGYRRVW